MAKQSLEKWVGKVHCMDCLEGMKQLPDGCVDLVVTDPPYGINLNVTQRHNAPRHSKQFRTEYTQIIGDSSKFDFQRYYRRSLAKEQFWWGANNYCWSLPHDGSWLVWDRKLPQQSEVPGSDFELCWSQQKHAYKMIRVMWTGYQAKEQGEERKHPTQKPIALMAWIIARYSVVGNLILDPFMGSGTTAVACKQLGRRFIGFEINPDYVKICNQRLKQEELFNAR